MELAIPLVALGGLYIINKKPNNNNNTINNVPCTETFTNPAEYADNTMITNNNDNEINTYNQPNNNFTNTYYSGSNTETIDQTFTSINGDTINRKKFEHNNMVPFFGKSKTNGDFDALASTDALLDSLQGSHSLDIKKEEQAPLFSPEDNIQWANGVPNQTEFIRSRQVVSQSMNNINPWGDGNRNQPGLNKNYTTNDDPGFNSGMQERDSWKPKTVDDLRVETNPKISYKLNNYEGPAHSKVKERGLFGKMEKHLPDKYYENAPNRYFTTTGIEKAQTVRSIQNNKPVNRAVSMEYTGIPKVTNEARIKESNYRVNNKAFKQLPETNMGPMQGISSVPVLDKDSNLGFNNRSVGNQQHNPGIVSGVVSSITSPIMDILKPTRKQDLVNSVRISGNPASKVPKNTIFDNKNKLKTTTKETTQFCPYDYGSRPIDYNGLGGYDITEQQPVCNQRDNTSVSYQGGANSNNQQTSYTAGYNQTSNTHRCNKMEMGNGNTNMFNNNLNQTANNNKSVTHIQYMQGANGNMNSSIPSAANKGEMHTKVHTDNTPNRLDANLLNAFKNNPYTHSLSSVA